MKALTVLAVLAMLFIDFYAAIPAALTGWLVALLIDRAAA